MQRVRQDPASARAAFGFAPWHPGLIVTMSDFFATSLRPVNRS
ncbi:hypothetical protein [Herminiimonas sp. CN]|nr:hypothetical protein [Herminiimonas sp. CN]